MDAALVQRQIAAIAAEFAQERRERQLRRELDPADFARLRDAGFLLTGVPAELGGLWRDPDHSTRLVADLVRTLAHGDPSIALVAAMHPTVLAFWLATPQAPTPFTEAWTTQQIEVYRTALNGAWWGTITSEPGSGGDVGQTRAVAQPGPNETGYQITGEKHFGSGSGITSFMLTTAVPAGEAEPDLFFLDVRGVPWDGSRGMQLVAPWDGHGMPATQSHAFRFTDFPAARLAWEGNLLPLAAATGAFIACVFTAVTVGIVETALETAQRQFSRRHAGLRVYEQVEWVRAEQEGWLIQQAYEGMLRASEADVPALLDALRGKTAIAELAESALGRLCRVIGGGTYARQSPFGGWFEDVRALGFLRPPWGLAYDRLFSASWPLTT